MIWQIICTYIWSHRPAVSYQKTVISQCSPNRVAAGGPKKVARPVAPAHWDTPTTLQRRIRCCAPRLDGPGPTTG